MRQRRAGRQSRNGSESQHQSPCHDVHLRCRQFLLSWPRVFCLRAASARSYTAVRVKDAPLREFITRYPRLFVLTGAGCSTASGIPDYRDGNGDWKRARPVMLQAFLASELTRQRYWARSLVGWHRMSAACPNDAHLALAKLERLGRVEALVTQNVD